MERVNVKRYCRGLLVAVLACLLAACGDDYYYPSVRQDFLTAFSGADGRLETVLTDEGETFRVVEDASGMRVGVDAAIRIVANYETLTTDDKVAGVKLYALLQAISPVPLAADEFEEGVKTEPSEVQSIWLGHDYLNIILKVKQQGKHLFHYYNEVVGFMRNLFSSALKDNENLEFGILTGILRIAKESLFSGLNNLVVNTILDNKYSEYFGFTVNDISNMAAYYGKAEKLSEIKEWYDGYLFGNTEIYNPWSVINYFNNNCKPKAFWSRTSGNEIIGELIRSSDKEVYESLSLLLQGKEVQSIINTDIIYPEVNADSDTIYSFLLVAGYLRATSVISEFNDNPICSLKLPNREIKSVFQKEILDNYNTLFNGSLLRDSCASEPV